MIQKKKIQNEQISSAKKLAKLFLNDGDYDNAIRECSIVIKKFSKWLMDNPDSELFALRGKSLLYADACFRKEAEKDIRRAISHDINNSELWKLLEKSRSKGVAPEGKPGVFTNGFIGPCPPNLIPGEELQK